METVTDFIFLGSKITADGNYSHEMKRQVSWKKSYDQPRQHIKKQRHYFANKGPSDQCCGFSSSLAWMWELDYKESWAPKNWCFWTVVLEKTLGSPLDSKVIKPVHPKGNQSWIFIGRIDAEAEIQYFGHLMQELTHWKRPWCWERLKAGREGDDRGWDGWIASPTQWTWVWAISGSWWWTGKPGMLQSMASQSQTWLSNWTELTELCTQPSWYITFKFQVFLLLLIHVDFLHKWSYHLQTKAALCFPSLSPFLLFLFLALLH